MKCAPTRQPVNVGSTPYALVVEDDAETASTIAAVFEMQGFVTEVAASLAAAQRALRERRPDVTSVDLKLPDGHGFEFVANARRLGVEHIIVVSGETSRDNVLATLEWRVVHYLVKPMRLSALLQAVADVKASLATADRSTSSRDGTFSGRNESRVSRSRLEN